MTQRQRRTTHRLIRHAASLLVLVLVVGWSAGSAQAQRTDGAIGVGGQIGDPSGLTLKIYHPNSLSYDFLAAWDLSHDFFFLNVHGLYERPLGTTAGAQYFFGPGAYLGARNDDLVLGISGTIGASFLIERFEFYGQLTPRLRVVPDTNGDLGGGIGVRYYF